jgi:hypothetical protein
MKGIPAGSHLKIHLEDYERPVLFYSLGNESMELMFRQETGIGSDYIDAEPFDSLSENSPYSWASDIMENESKNLVLVSEISEISSPSNNSALRGESGEIVGVPNSNYIYFEDEDIFVPIPHSIKAGLFADNRELYGRVLDEAELPQKENEKGFRSFQ